MRAANAEFPPFPEYTVNTGPVHTAFFFTVAGLGVLGDEVRHMGGRDEVATPEMGERYLEAGVRSTLAVLDNIERTFAAMPPR